MLIRFSPARTVALALVALLLHASSSSAQSRPDAPAAPPTSLPGVWAEFEAGQGDTRPQDFRTASGTKIIGWFDAGKKVVLTFDLPQAMDQARLYLRYNNAMSKPGELAATILTDPATRREAGKLIQPNSPRWDDFRWTSIQLGALPAGKQRIEFSCPPKSVCGGLDVAVLLDDHWQGLYQPPTYFAKGKPVGVGQLVSPVTAALKASAPGGEYERRAPVAFSLTLQNRATTAMADTLRWSVEDHDGKSFITASMPLSLKAGEGRTIDIAVKDGVADYGWYIVKARIGNVPVGEGYFVCLPKVTRPVPSEAMIRTMLADGAKNWLGMNLGYGTPDDVIPDFREAGLQTIRTGGNKANPAEHDAHLQQLIGAGLRVHWIINYRGNGIAPKGTAVGELAALDLNGPVMKQWFDNYKARCLAFMRYYSQPGKERLRFYVVGNEPDKKDAHTGLAGRPDVAVRLTRAMAEAANEVNPTGIFVQSPSMSQPDAEYLRRMIVDLGVANHCDIIGTHMYGSQTLSARSGKPAEWLKLAGARRIVACTESGVTTGWTPKGYPGREWQSDFVAMSYIMTHRFGYVAQILFTHDEDHTSDWALMRDKGVKLQPTWDLIQNVLTKPRRLTNGEFEIANDPRAMWTPHVNIDIPGWLSERFDWQHADRPHAGKSSVRFAPDSPGNPILSRREKGQRVAELAPEPLIVYQIVTDGITPGKPVTVSAFSRTTGTPGTTAILSVQGFDPLNGLARSEASTASANWTQLLVTVTPVNPWIVIGLEAPPTAHANDFVWFDDVTVSPSPASSTR